jgi:hypothetical protein
MGCGEHGHYTAGCGACQTGARRHSSIRRHGLADGTWLPRVPIAEVRRHLFMLRRRMAVVEIAAAAGVAKCAVVRISRKDIRKAGKWVNGRVAASILAVEVPRLRRRAPRCGMVSALAATRRTRALSAVGYPISRQHATSGASRAVICQLRGGKLEWITPALDRKIKAMYDRLPIPAENPDRRPIVIAEREGWGAPHMWDDDTIADPKAKPARDAPAPSLTDVLRSNVEFAIAGDVPFSDLTTAEAIEVCTVLIARGWTHERIGEHLQWGSDGDKCRDNCAAFCQRHGIEAAPERVRMIAITEALQLRGYLEPAAA